MKTSRDIQYNIGNWNRITIPAGTKVIPATNLPGDDKHWCEPWEGMSESAQSWMESYGFLVYDEEVEEDDKKA